MELNEVENGMLISGQVEELISKGVIAIVSDVSDLRCREEFSTNGTDLSQNRIKVRVSDPQPQGYEGFSTRKL